MPNRYQKSRHIYRNDHRKSKRTVSPDENNAFEFLQLASSLEIPRTAIARFFEGGVSRAVGWRRGDYVIDRVS